MILQFLVNKSVDIYSINLCLWIQQQKYRDFHTLVHMKYSLCQNFHCLRSCYGTTNIHTCIYKIVMFYIHTCSNVIVLSANISAREIISNSKPRHGENSYKLCLLFNPFFQIFFKSNLLKLKKKHVREYLRIFHVIQNVISQESNIIISYLDQDVTYYRSVTHVTQILCLLWDIKISSNQIIAHQRICTITVFPYITK